VLTNNTEINPAQTESSKTAASGEFNLNISAVNIKLVNASPIAERSRLRVITVHKAAAAKIIKMMASMCKLSPQNTA
jgi:hypothetical protein